MLLCVDCVFNEALLAPLIATIDYLIAGTGIALVVVELRQEDVVREFLRSWIELPGWEVWRAGDDLLGPQFAAWVGWKNAIV